jgi:acyl-CoA synthetase (AMP-forming)/AMP-acid ligase II
VAVISFIEQLHRLAADRPDRPAVTCGDEMVTYPQLIDRIDDLANELRGLGVGEGDMVTIALPNSVEWFVAFAAAWRLGATPQPVSSRLPQREIDAIVELANPRRWSACPTDRCPGELRADRSSRPGRMRRHRAARSSCRRSGRRPRRAAPPGAPS